jgi:putative transposase
MPEMLPRVTEHWPHAPPHWLFANRAYMITAGTFGKAHFFGSSAEKDAVIDHLFDATRQARASLQAWAVLSNHYHIIVSFADTPESLDLRQWLRTLHIGIATTLNSMHSTPGRRVMHQYWDTALTYEKSWMARLRYVNNNPVHHRVVTDATRYKWCSAGWFETNASTALVKSVARFRTDRINVPDDF